MSLILDTGLTPQQRSDCAANDLLLKCSAEECLACDQGRACPRRYGTPTVRRHPRSLADAFPDVRKHSFEPHVAPPLWKRISLFLRRFA